MAEITVNVSEYELRRSREAFLRGALDAKRPTAWDQYGYPNTVSFEQLLQSYERNGPGFGAVHRILDICWQDMPRIKLPEQDEETPAEKKLAKALKAINFWAKFVDFDRRNLVGRYAGLIFRVRDGKQLREPLVGKHALVDVVPVFESQLKVTAWVSDVNSPDYGKPAMYQFRQRQVQQGDTQGQPTDEVEVHPSRVQILAEGSPSGDLFEGVPLLRAGFNHLIDLEKIAGGSGESFLKNSARTLQFKFDKDANLTVIKQNEDGTTTTGTVGQVIEEKVDRLNRSIDSSIVVQGGEASSLQTTVADPEPSFLVAGNLFACAVRLPFTILFGQQTGRLASDQDQKDYRQRGKSRRELVLTPAIEEFIRRGQAHGWVPEGEWEVEWKPLDAPGDKEKGEQAERLAKINQAMAAAGHEPPFSPNEVRKVLGYEDRAELPDMPEEGDPDADPNADPAAQRGGAPAPVPAPAPVRRAA